MIGEIYVDLMLLIDQNLNKTERFLSKCAALPVLGTPFAAIKVLILSPGQLITGFALGILSIPLRCTNHCNLNDYCWSHVKHGLGNIVAGTFEAIPLIGLGIHMVRKKRAVHDLSVSDDDYDSTHTCYFSNHEDKFMPYQSLVKRDSICFNYNLSQCFVRWKRDLPSNKDWKPLEELPNSLKSGY